MSLHMLHLQAPFKPINCHRVRFRSLPRALSQTITVTVTMQHGVPAYIAQSARCLFRECLRRADYVGNQYGSNSEVLKSLVRDQFRRNMHETDPEKIEAQKEVAARALFNHMYYEAGRMAHENAEAALIKESLLGLPRPALGMTLQDEDSSAST